MEPRTWACADYKNMHLITILSVACFRYNDNHSICWWLKHFCIYKQNQNFGQKISIGQIVNRVYQSYMAANSCCRKGLRPDHIRKATHKGFSISWAWCWHGNNVLGASNAILLETRNQSEKIFNLSFVRLQITCLCLCSRPHFHIYRKTLCTVLTDKPKKQ